MKIENQSLQEKTDKLNAEIKKYEQIDNSHRKELEHQEKDLARLQQENEQERKKFFELRSGIDLDNEKIMQYESNTNGALSSVHSGDYQMVFLVNPTKIEQILEITGNSLIMPRKSTYFHPKIVSGLVFNKIDPYETVYTPRQ